jgi:hypothetical protein
MPETIPSFPAALRHLYREELDGSVLFYATEPEFGVLTLNTSRASYLFLPYQENRRKAFAAEWELVD